MTPTEAGWYWATHGDVRTVVRVGFDVSTGIVERMGFPQNYNLSAFTDWSAKIPDPGPGGMLVDAAKLMDAHFARLEEKQLQKLAADICDGVSF